MATKTNEQIRRQAKVYILIFCVIFLLTIVNVIVSYIYPGPVWMAIIAISIAVIQAFLAAGFFMHLISERTAISAFLVLAIILAIAVLLLPLFGYFNQY